MSLKQYDVITKLGAGSFGVVFKAKQKKTNQIYVIKQIQISKLDARLKKWAMNQAKLMKQINSAYIVKYYNSFVQTSKLFIVMQYCPKGDLCKYIKSQMGKPIPETTIWKFTIQIMIGLRDLHSKKILHRDIKTLNIFLDQNFNVRVGDLGVAKTMSTDFTNTIVGTPYYLSPQMCQQKPYNQKTDIWAFGCLVYELCTGKHPFEAQNQAALALKIVMGKFQDIPSFYSKDLRWLIQSCLSVDYKRRPSINYLLGIPRILEQATKLNITIQASNTKKQDMKIEPQPKNKKLQGIQKLVQNATNKVDEVVKKVASVQKLPLHVPKSNFAKNQIKSAQQGKYSKKQMQIINGQSRSSQQKRKSLDVKKGNLPPKQQTKQRFGQQLQNKSYKQLHKQGKSKQRVKLQNPPLAKVVANDRSTPVTARFQSQNQPMKKQVVQTKKQAQKKQNLPPNLLQQPKSGAKNVTIDKANPTLGQKRKPVTPTQQIVEKVGIKNQFNVQDRKEIQEDECQIVDNLDMLDLSHRVPQIRNQVDAKEQSLKNAKKNAFVNSKVQQEIDDESLMAQFGITPQKKQILNDFSLMKSKSINWDLQSSKNSCSLTQMKDKHPNSCTLTQNKQPIKGEQSIKIDNIPKTTFKQLPTSKTKSGPQQVSVLIQSQDSWQGGVQQQNEIDDQHFYGQEDDNKPYKSDDQQEGERQGVKSKLRDAGKGEQNSEFQEDQRYLVQNIQAEFQQQGRQAMQKTLQLYSRRLLENQKRLLHLQNLNGHTQKQYFSHLPKQTYKQLKQKINTQNDKEVDKLMKQLTKGKQQLMGKFLKIMGFQMEIDLCERNIKECKQKNKELKQRIEKGDYI